MRATYRVLAYLLALEVVVQAAAIAWAVFGLSTWIENGGVLDKAGMESEGTAFDGVLGFAVHGINGQMIVPAIALILFVVSFFIQFVEPGYAHPVLPFLVLGAVVQVCSGLYLTALIFGGRFLAGQFQRRRRLAAGAAGGVGALFVGFGVKLATASVG